jgi:hypothetical protein
MRSVFGLFDRQEPANRRMTRGKGSGKEGEREER